ncbi:MAG TPA: hypothetical protein VKX41_19625 [Alloacidobacterium sp.]|jgi:hypothetical protein|nr:hypothetical protein [Alloacidobacterium sp.]
MFIASPSSPLPVSAVGLAYKLLEMRKEVIEAVQAMQQTAAWPFHPWFSPSVEYYVPSDSQSSTSRPMSKG